MFKNTQRVNRCNICNSNDSRVLETTGRFKIVKCKKCGFVYIDPQLVLTELEQHYDEDYYSEWFNQMEGRIPMWGKRLRELERFKRGGQLLDVGCGIGTFLNLAQRSGWEVYGTEISKWAVNYIQEKLKINVFRGYLTEAKFPQNYFDVVTMWHVLEHMLDPKSELIEIKGILKKDGLIVIAVPNVNYWRLIVVSFINRRGRPPLFDENSPEPHINFFSSRTLTKLLTETGYRVIKVAYDEPRVNWNFSITHDVIERVFFYLKLNIGEAIKVYATNK